MTVVQLLVVSTSQLVFSHAWTTGPIQYLTDDRPAISWTCRHEHLSTLQNPPFLSPYYPQVGTQTLTECPWNNGLLTETASTVFVTDLHSLSLRQGSFPPFPASAIEQWNHSPSLADFYVARLWAQFSAVVETEHYILGDRSLCVRNCNVAELFHTQNDAL